MLRNLGLLGHLLRHIILSCRLSLGHVVTLALIDGESLELPAQFGLTTQANHHVTFVIEPDIAGQSWLGLLIIHIFVFFDPVWLLILKFIEVDLSVWVLLTLDNLQDIE